MKSLYSIFFFSMFISFCFSQEGEAMGAVVRDHDNKYPPKHEIDKDPVFENYYVDVQAEYPGGLNLLRKFIYRNIEYPKKAIENRTQGMIMLKFIIEIDGTVSDVMVINKRLGYGLDEIAIDLIKKTSWLWTPALIKDTPVRSYYRFPVKFNLPQEGPEPTDTPE